MTEDLHAKAPDIPEAMTVTLGSYPNPDFPDGRRGPMIKPYRGPCFDLQHAVGRCRRFIASYDLGGGNWVGGVGVVRRGEEVIAFISYNGRIRYAPGPTSGSAAPALYRGYQITLDFDCPLGGLRVLP